MFNDEYQTPPHETLAYRPTEIESKWRNVWHPRVSQDISIDFGTARYLIVQDFFTRFNALGAAVPRPDFGNSARPPSAELATNDTNSGARNTAEQRLLGLSNRKTHELAPIYGDNGETAEQTKERLSVNVTVGSKPVGTCANCPSVFCDSERLVDRVRIAILRGPSVDRAFELNNLDLLGADRLLGRVWRLARTAPATISTLREMQLPIDRELIDATDTLFDEVLIHVSNHNPAQAVARITTHVNDTYRYASSDVGPHTRTLLRACDAIVLLLSPVAPFVCTELFQIRKANDFQGVERTS